MICWFVQRWSLNELYHGNAYRPSGSFDFIDAVPGEKQSPSPKDLSPHPTLVFGHPRCLGNHNTEHFWFSVRPHPLSVLSLLFPDAAFLTFLPIHTAKWEQGTIHPYPCTKEGNPGALSDQMPTFAVMAWPHFENYPDAHHHTWLVMVWTINVPQSCVFIVWSSAFGLLVERRTYRRWGPVERNGHWRYAFEGDTGARPLSLFWFWI